MSGYSLISSVLSPDQIKKIKEYGIEDKHITRDIVIDFIFFMKQDKNHDVLLKRIDIKRDKCLRDLLYIRNQAEHDSQIQDLKNALTGANVPAGRTICGRCRSNKVIYTLKQTRGADEEQTVLFKCSNCLLQWKR